MNRIKEGVSLRGIRPELAIAYTIASAVLALYGLPAIITSGTDGTHGRGSHHYAGGALDLRTKHLRVSSIPPRIFRDRIAAQLGSEFDVVLEDLGGDNEHLHIEFHPKGPANR